MAHYDRSGRGKTDAVVLTLTVKADGGFPVSEPADYCGGPPPVSTVSYEKIFDIVSTEVSTSASRGGIPISKCW